MAKDYTQYQFNGETYGKARLVLAVVRAYIQKHKPTIEALRKAFPNEVQGRREVICTEDEFNERLNISDDVKKRFFTQNEDRIIVDGQKILVSSQWGEGNISAFIAKSNSLGFDVKETGQGVLALSDDEIIQHFLPQPAFANNYQNWPETVLNAFCELMRTANLQELDIYFTQSNGGYPLRLGRKGVNNSIAVEVCVWCKLTHDTAFLHIEDDIELSSAAVQQLIASDRLVEFSQKFPIKRAAHWPNEYSNKTNTDEQVCIWKVSHSPKVEELNTTTLKWLSNNNVLAIHENTGNGSVGAFKKMKEGDIVSLGLGNTVYRLVRVISSIEYIKGSSLSQEWLMRKYEIIKSLDKPVKYQGENKRWSPRFPGTSWEVPKNEYCMFEEEILQPYYELTLEELGFDASQISKPRIHSISVESMEKTPLNQIFYGPPGTGKTYQLQQLIKNYTSDPEVVDPSIWLDEHLKELTWMQVVALCLLDIGEKSKVKQIINHEYYQRKAKLNNREGNLSQTAWSFLQQFTTEDSKTVSYKNRSEPSVFDKTPNSEWYIVKDKLELIDDLITLYESLKEGPQSKEVIKRFSSTTFHQSYGYEEFIQGLKAKSTKDNGISYAVESGVFTKLCERASKDPNHRYAMFIDEINRGNISKIFGELITLIEPDKRKGCANEMTVQLTYNGEAFSVPENIDIIGTMNTADRSLAMMDTALRRRFDFVEMMPEPELFAGKSVNGIKLELLLSKMNERIEVLYDREHTLGHAFFMPVANIIDTKGEPAAFAELQKVFKNKIIPLLEEYFFEDWNKIRLVLGDNRKQSEALKPYVFVREHTASYNEIFGEGHGLETYEDKKTTFSLADFNDKNLAWHQALAYQAIYDEAVLKFAAKTDEAPASGELSNMAEQSNA